MTSFKDNKGSCEPKNFTKQIERLRLHNIDIKDTDIHKLVNINYACVYHYASIYAGVNSYDDRNDKFRTKLNFDDVYNLYLLDMNYSFLLFKLISKFEKSIKSIFACKLSCDFNIRNYKDADFVNLYIPNSFVGGTNVDEYISTKKEIQKTHFDVLGAPLWKIIEYLDLGDIKYLIKNAKTSKEFPYRAKIGKYVKLSDLEYVRQLRNNICHFSPLVGNFRCSQQDLTKRIDEQLISIVKKYCKDPKIYENEVKEIDYFLQMNSEFAKMLINKK